MIALGSTLVLVLLVFLLVLWQYGCLVSTLEKFPKLAKLRKDVQNSKSATTVANLNRNAVTQMGVIELE